MGTQTGTALVHRQRLLRLRMILDPELRRRRNETGVAKTVDKLSPRRPAEHEISFGSQIAHDMIPRPAPGTQAKRAQAAAVYDWFRRRLVLIIVAIMLLLQFLTWRAIESIAQGCPEIRRGAANTTLAMSM
jgi:hypothetical protein